MQKWSKNMKVTIKSKAELSRLGVHPDFINKYAGKTFEVATLSLKGMPGYILTAEQIEEVK